MSVRAPTNEIFTKDAFSILEHYHGPRIISLLNEAIISNSEIRTSKDAKELALELTIGHKLANGLRLSLLTHNNHPDILSVFGIDSTYSFNQVQWSDHGLDHVRRMHRLMDLLIASMPDYYKKIKNPIFLYAFELFPYFHDLDQLLTLMSNDINERNGLEGNDKPKKGHALAAAVMIMALTDKYLESAHMDKNEREAVEQLTAISAIMIMKHDEPERLDEALSREGKITGENLKELSTDKLFEVFNNNQLDLFSLSRKQIIDILLKTKSGKSKYGLYREFEREYENVLENMKKDDRPLVLNPKNEDVEAIQNLTRIAVLADKIDMVYPPFESIIRLLNTRISHDRSWWDSAMTPDKMHKIIVEQGGNYTDEGDCDVRRLLWEALDSAKQAKKMSENQNMSNSFVYQLEMEHSLMRILAVKEFGNGIMVNQKKSIIDSIYDKRIELLGKKVLRRMGLKEDFTTVKELTDTIEKTKFPNKNILADRFKFRIRSLAEEAKKVKKMIQEKKGIDSTNDFNTTCDMVLMDVCKIFSIEPEGPVVNKLKNKIHSNVKEFYSTYDSLGGVPDIWTTPGNQEHYEIWRKLINGYIHDYEFYKMRGDVIDELRKTLLYTS
jgi:hypothetical protein